MIRAFIAWGVRRTHYCDRVGVVTFDRKRLFKRFAFLWPDEIVRKDKDGRPNWYRPPWWRPFNAFLHCWRPEPGSQEGFHDHPRWSITVCLQGKIIERTPWGDRTLTPGSIVIRSRKAIHAFQVPDGYAGRTWTLFVVGRRNHRQNTYVITPR